jgi:hypothetical protein
VDKKALAVSVFEKKEAVFSSPITFMKRDKMVLMELNAGGS